ncbi:MAG: YkvA family protein [Burkholderiaceae bacterium]
MRWTRLLTLLRLTGRDALTLFAALSDADMPRRLKVGVLALVLYVLSPIDLLPDLALMLGWADDLALLMVGIPWLASRLPAAVRDRARLRVSRWLRDAPGPRNP